MKRLFIVPIFVALFAFGNLGTANAQTSPTLLVDLVNTGVASSIGPNMQNVILANVRLDTTLSSDAIRLTSLPIMINTGNGANATSLTSCQLTNATNTNLPLNSGNNVTATSNSGANNFVFDNPITLPKGTVTNLLLNCDISGSLVAGGTYQFSINSANVNAVAVSTGLPATVGVSTGGVNIPFPTVPGVPNTGFGDKGTMNLALIISAIVVAGLGVAYTRRVAR